MANNLTSNPISIDTASGSTITNKKVQLIQWIDDNADIGDTDDLVFVINGVTVTIKVQVANGENVVFYQSGPFSDPIFVTSMTVSTIDHGVLLVWCK